MGFNIFKAHKKWEQSLNLGQGLRFSGRRSEPLSRTTTWNYAIWFMLFKESLQELGETSTLSTNQFGAF